MRDQYEIVHVSSSGAEQILSRTVPNGYADRWQLVKKLAVDVLPYPVKETGENPHGLSFVVANLAYPEAGVVGIRERA